MRTYYYFFKVFAVSKVFFSKSLFGVGLGASPPACAYENIFFKKIYYKNKNTRSYLYNRVPFIKPHRARVKKKLSPPACAYKIYFFKKNKKTKTLGYISITECLLFSPTGPCKRKLSNPACARRCPLQ